MFPAGWCERLIMVRKEIGLSILFLAFLLIGISFGIYELMEYIKPMTGPAEAAPESLQGLSFVALAIFALVGVSFVLVVLRIIKR